MYRASRHEADCFDKNSKMFSQSGSRREKEKAGKGPRKFSHTSRDARGSGINIYGNLIKLIFRVAMALDHALSWLQNLMKIFSFALKLLFKRG